MPADLRIAGDPKALACQKDMANAKKRDPGPPLLEQRSERYTPIPARCRAELFRVLRGKALRHAGIALDAVPVWANAFQSGNSTVAAFVAAMDLCADHHLRVWNAFILTVAPDHDWRLRLSDHLKHRLRGGGVTLVNPIAHPPHPLLTQRILPS